jgi:carbamoyl-phosphate synthase large subunit
VLVEESLLGWDEFELEVMRDRNDNVVIVLLDREPRPDGVHTGDSVTVAPQMTLPTRPTRSFATPPRVIRAVGVETAARTSSSRASARPASCA